MRASRERGLTLEFRVTTYASPWRRWRNEPATHILHVYLYACLIACAENDGVCLIAILRTQISLCAWGGGRLRCAFHLSGIGGRTVAKLAREIFEDTCLAPQVVYLAVGVNDCFNGRTGDNAILGITDTIKIIRHFSPATKVVVQKVLPTTKPDESYRGKLWKDQDYYKCVQHINARVGRFIRKNRESCVSHVDFTNLILDSEGRFRAGIYDDGVHFYKNGDMNKYCDAIADELESSSSRDTYEDESGSSDSSSKSRNDRFASDLINATAYLWTYSKWTKCEGVCGTQRRTAMCMMQNPGNTTTMLEPANEASCEGTFMNSLARICKIKDDCDVNGFLQDRTVLTMQPGSILLGPSDVARNIIVESFS